MKKERKESMGIEPKVIAVGGIFFYSENIEKTNEWYQKNLGFEINSWGSASFDLKDEKNAEVINPLQWKTFKKENKHFAPSKKGFMINYQVQNLEGLISQLKKNKVEILDDLTTFDYGKFAYIMDCDGNKIELWEPIL